MNFEAQWLSPCELYMLLGDMRSADTVKLGASIGATPTPDMMISKLQTLEVFESIHQCGPVPCRECAERVAAIFRVH